MGGLTTAVAGGGLRVRVRAACVCACACRCRMCMRVRVCVPHLAQRPRGGALEVVLGLLVEG